MSGEVIDLRRRGLPIRFGDEETEARFLVELQDAIRQQTVEFAVSPRCQLKTDKGKVLRAGDEVTFADFDHPESLYREIRCSRVIEWTSPGPEAA